jgi:predicted DNA-binding transcriptional regulator AlpA
VGTGHIRLRSATPVRSNVLQMNTPRVYPSRGRSREQAAAHIGVGETKFDQMVADGRMPQPFAIDGRVVWCVYELDDHFDRLPRRHQNAGTQSIHNTWADQRAA